MVEVRRVGCHTTPLYKAINLPPTTCKADSSCFSSQLVLQLPMKVALADCGSGRERGDSKLFNIAGPLLNCATATKNPAV